MKMKGIVLAANQTNSEMHKFYLCSQVFFIFVLHIKFRGKKTNKQTKQMWNAVRLDLKKNLCTLCQKCREVTLWHTRTATVLSGYLSCCFSYSWVNQLRHGQALDHGGSAEEREGKCYTWECFSFPENAERHSRALHLEECLFAVAECNCKM